MEELKKIVKKTMKDERKRTMVVGAGIGIAVTIVAGIIGTLTIRHKKK